MIRRPSWLFLLVFAVPFAAAQQTVPGRAPLPTPDGAAFRALQDHAKIGVGALGLKAETQKALGNVQFDDAARESSTVDAGDGEAPPVVKVRPRKQDFGEDDGGETDGGIGDIIRDVLKDPAVQEAIGEFRKEQAEKFGKELVDNVMKDERVQKLVDGPAKTKSILVNSGVAGAGALLGGIGFAVGVSALGYLGVGLLAAGLIGLLIAWLA